MITKPPFEVIAPAEQRIPFVFNSPHSGRDYPASFLAASRLDERTIRRSEDTFVDELFSSVVPLGAPLMRAHFPRAWLDVNREPYELDPRMFDGELPPYANVRSLRVAGGLGTIARVVSENVEIYADQIPVAEALARIETVYKPYHDRLRALMAETHQHFGFVVLVDCHSMPSSIRTAPLRVRADFVIGDRYGASCAPELSEGAYSFLTDAGYSVARNKPYAGGFITEHYGRPLRGLHALQIEVNRGLYMNERNFQKNIDFETVARDLARLVAFLSSIPDTGLFPVPEAAE
ncbi:N-formylglutamate amidohydrolase [Kaistia dalseonensis]|uniref:N-formylglutamate amidohydrolase n=1 Tax=Kaistia dalseonensis TaxID=410840 RepID=A0ABU0HCF0_9HYPH|nr:N-formylglutamate amidohydrolase [Kaistia dalseonensis]MCX5496809.1 N-formylglutamate amidohydrolase [Kaistia dalseonensis]MDQ0439435.1 N-formylglutamate amidohydrolase [Kaistia dalseonensis]